MGKLEATIKSEIERLAKRELHKVSVPLKQDVRLLKNKVSQIRKAVLALERFVARQAKEIGKASTPLEASDEEVKASRFSPRLLRSLRKRLGVSQKELAVLTGVTIGAAHLWEAGKFRPKNEKMAVLVGLRKLGRVEVRKLLEEKGTK
jgi:DNA-binding transcriptional regulator YiaG